MPSKEEFKNLRDPFYSYLEEQFLERRKKNPSYSLRAFARLLDVDQSSLSKAFKGKRSFSYRTIKSILQKLQATSEILELFESESVNRNSESTVLSEDQVIGLCNWKYWAIIEMIKIDGNYSAEIISTKLSIPVKELKTRLGQLERLGFIEKSKKGYRLLKPNNTWINTDKTSDARRQLQKQYLKMSLNALDNVPFAKRDHSSLTIAIDKKRLPEIRNKIAKFHKELGDFGQKKGKIDEVYQITVSLFPLSQG